MPAPSALRAWRLLARFDEPFVTITVRGTSMLSTLPDGARVRLERVGRRGVWPGDIVVYAHRGALVCHRVVWKRRRALLVAGDARSSVAAWVSPRRVLGRVRSMEVDAADGSAPVRALASGGGRALASLARLVTAVLVDLGLAGRRTLLRALAG
jgi:hypothetical protein